MYSLPVDTTSEAFKLYKRNLIKLINETATKNIINETLFRTLTAIPEYLPIALNITRTNGTTYWVTLMSSLDRNTALKDLAVQLYSLIPLENQGEFYSAIPSRYSHLFPIGISSITIPTATSAWPIAANSFAPQTADFGCQADSPWGAAGVGSLPIADADPFLVDSATQTDDLDDLLLDSTHATFPSAHPPIAPSSIPAASSTGLTLPSQPISRSQSAFSRAPVPRQTDLGLNIDSRFAGYQPGSFAPFPKIPQ